LHDPNLNRVTDGRQGRQTDKRAMAYKRAVAYAVVALKTQIKGKSSLTFYSAA